MSVNQEAGGSDLLGDVTVRNAEITALILHGTATAIYKKIYLTYLIIDTARLASNPLREASICCTVSSHLPAVSLEPGFYPNTNLNYYYPS